MRGGRGPSAVYRLARGLRLVECRTATDAAVGGSILPLLRNGIEDRGEVELKGFDQPVRAWAVRWDG